MSTEQQAASASPSIHPGTAIGLVTLRVSDLERSRHFYEGILGFQPIEQTPGKVVLGDQEKQPLLELIEVPGATPQPRRATGLYHVAILFPTRADLGRALLRLARAGYGVGQTTWSRWPPIQSICAAWLKKAQATQNSGK